MHWCPLDRLTRGLLVPLSLLLALSGAGSTSTLEAIRAGMADGRAQEEESCRPLPEPPSAAAFIESQRDWDLAKASLVTSHLYRAEMERRGRAADWPFDILWTGVTSILDFTFVGAVADDQAFTHALYTARPKSPGPNGSPTTVWRIDLDPEGEVIWGELTKIIYRSAVRTICTPAVELGPRTDSPTLAQLSRLFSRLSEERLAFGVRSENGDGYVALLPVREGSRWHNAANVAFAVLDESGDLRDSYWSFGLPAPTWDDENRRVGSGSFDRRRMAPTDLRVLAAYLQSLE